LLAVAGGGTVRDVPASVELPCRFAIVPLLAQGRAAGALAISGSAPGAWTEAELRVLSVIGRSLVGAVERRELFRAAVAKASREALLNEVAGMLEGTDESSVAIRRALR